MSHLDDADVALLSDAGISIHRVVVPHALTPHGPSTLVDATRHGQPVRLRVQWYEHPHEAVEAGTWWRELSASLVGHDSHIEPLDDAITLSSAVVLVTVATRPLTRELTRRPADAPTTATYVSHMVSALTDLRDAGWQTERLAVKDLVVNGEGVLLVSHTTTMHAEGSRSASPRTVGVVEQLRQVINELAQAHLIDSDVARQAVEQLASVIDNSGSDAMSDAALTLREPATGATRSVAHGHQETMSATGSLPRPGKNTRETPRRRPAYYAAAATLLCGVVVLVAWGVSTLTTTQTPSQQSTPVAADVSEPSTSASDNQLLEATSDLISTRYQVIQDATVDPTQEIKTSDFAADASPVAQATTELITSLREQQVSVTRAEVTMHESLVDSHHDTTAEVTVSYELEQTLSGLGEEPYTSTYHEEATMTLQHVDGHWRLVDVTPPRTKDNNASAEEGKSGN